jgi:hypothetical protein
MDTSAPATFSLVGSKATARHFCAEVRIHNPTRIASCCLSFLPFLPGNITFTVDPASLGPQIGLRSAAVDIQISDTSSRHPFSTSITRFHFDSLVFGFSAGLFLVVFFSVTVTQAPWRNFQRETLAVSVEIDLEA